MEQVGKESYTKKTLYNIPTDSNTRLTYIYQLKNEQQEIRSKESVSSPRLSLVTMGDIDEWLLKPNIPNRF